MAELQGGIANIQSCRKGLVPSPRNRPSNKAMDYLKHIIKRLDVTDKCGALLQSSMGIQSFQAQDTLYKT